MRKGNPIHGWREHRRGQRREGQVGRPETLAAQVRTAVREQSCHVVELAPDRGLVLSLAPRMDVQLAPQEANDQRPPVADRAVLPGGHAVVVEAQDELALGEHVDVQQPSPRRPQLLIEAPAQALNLAARRGLLGKQPVLRWSAPVDPREDLARLADRTIWRHEHGNGHTAARALGGELVDALDVALLAVGHCDPLQSPPRLFAVVADGDRDEPQHCCAVCAMCAVATARVSVCR